MKKILFLLSLCLLCTSVMHGQRGGSPSSGLLSATISHGTMNAVQYIDVTITNTSSYFILMMDWSRVYGDGRFVDQEGSSYMTFNIYMTNGGSMVSDRRYFADKPQTTRAMIQLQPGASYKIRYAMFNYDDFIGTFPCSPVTWCTLTGTLHAEYMVRDGGATNLKVEDIKSNAVGPNNTPPYNANDRRDGSGTRPTDRNDSGSGGTRSR